MIYIVYRMSGDPSGYWDEYYTVDSHYEKITQDIIDNIINITKIDIKLVNKTRWVEVFDYNFDPYDAVVIFNDKITNRPDYNKNLEEAISDYKREIRDDKIKSILNEW